MIGSKCKHLNTGPTYNNTLAKYICVLCIFIIDVTTVCFHGIDCNCVLSMPLLIPAVFCVICQPLSLYPHVYNRLPITACPWDMDTIFIYLPTKMFKMSRDGLVVHLLQFN